MNKVVIRKTHHYLGNNYVMPGYKVSLRLDYDELPDGFFSFDVNHRITDKDVAWDVALQVSSVLDSHGIEHEIVNETNKVIKK